MEHTLATNAAVDLTETWRRATIVIGALAAVELVMLVLLAGALLAKPTVEGATGKKPAAAKAATKKTTTPAVKPKPVPVAAAERPRSKVSVLVLNGNGVQGAAAALAQRVTGKGYRVGGVANAPTNDYTRTLVMYRPGFAGEGRRLAKDLGIAIVGPLDGMRASQLHGSHTVVVLGA